MWLLRFEDAELFRQERGAGRRLALQQQLTPREREVARLVAEGQTNREIARQLHKSRATVRNQVHAIYGKLRISRRAQLIGWIS
jgi:DNA-binding CsgD family transcriptional regulator